jgi:4'-phosphopantetheinyl transferase
VEREALGDDVHVWTVAPEAVSDPELLRRYAEVLSPEEDAQWRRFVFARHRHQYLVAHALVRATLSRYEDAPPASWRFSKNEYGKPAVAGPVVSDLRFNLSHTDGLVIVGVCRGSELGVDVEGTARGDQILEIATTVFSLDERIELAALPEERRSRRAVELWVLKEAYIKGIAIGLSLPLQGFSMREAHGSEGAFALHGGEPGWRVSVRERHDHLIGVALEREASVIVRDVVPFADER